MYSLGSFSYTNGTCYYYFYWVDVALDESVTISDDVNDFTVYVRQEYQGMTKKNWYENIYKSNYNYMVTFCLCLFWSLRNLENIINKGL